VTHGPVDWFARLLFLYALARLKHHRQTGSSYRDPLLRS
jgi:hypothetical protein